MPRQAKFEFKVKVTGNRRHANAVHEAVSAAVKKVSMKEKIPEVETTSVKALKS